MLLCLLTYLILKKRITVEPLPRLTCEKLIAANSVRRIVAKEVPQGFVLVLVTQTMDYTLNVNRRNEPRVFKALDTVAQAVSELGARNFDVELMNSPRNLNRSLI